MREIKFRVYNKSTKTMHYPTLEEVAVRANLKEMVLMQFTELKDKDGKAIWEGDIISNGTDIAEVKFGIYMTEELRDGNGWYALLNNFGIPLINPNKAIVIGNIYENPELLE